MAATTNQADTTLSAPHHIKATLPGRPASPIQAEAGRMRCEDGEHQGEEWVTRRPGGAEGTPAPFLDINVTHPHTQQAMHGMDMPATRQLTREQVKEKRQRGRLYQRMMTGFYWNRKERVRFLTLTSSRESPQDMQASFEELIRRIRREYGPFEYFAVFTDEGQGVIHSVYVGSYLPFAWVQETWKEIHRAFHVNIKDPNSYDRGKRKKAGKPGINHDHSERDVIYYPRGLVLYFLQQYLHGQQGIITITHSRGWVYPGFVGDWQRFRKKYPYRTIDEKKACIEAWHAFLDEKHWPQQELSDHGVTFSDEA